MVNISKERVIDIFSDFGNQISASLPMALHEAISNDRLKRGDKFLMVGTAAGITLGGMVIRY
jgi:3-oxoacyl-[acyl-carrier-protein] synthase-3